MHERTGNGRHEREVGQIQRGSDDDPRTGGTQRCYRCTKRARGLRRWHEPGQIVGPHDDQREVRAERDGPTYLRRQIT